MDLLVLDKNLRVVAIVDNYSSIIWTDRYQEAGDFELYQPMERSVLDYIKTDYYLWRKDSEHVMIIEKILIESDSEEGDYITVTGRSLESILDRRVVWGLRSLGGNFQTAIRTLLNECIISPSKPERKIDNFIFEDSDDPAITELTIEAQYTGDNLYDVIVAQCKEKGIGFKITLNESNQFVFKLYKGADRSYEQFQNPYVVFSPEFNNIVSSSYTEERSTLKNVTLVGGEGEGSERRFTAVGNTSGLDRREMFTDASSVSSDDGLDITSKFVFTQYPNQVFNDSSNTFVTDNNFSSCMVDVAEYAGRTISITIPKYTNASGATAPYSTILVNSSKRYISTLKAWESNGETASKGTLETYEIQLPTDAQYMYTSMFNQTAITNEVYSGELADFSCQTTKLSNAEYTTLLRQKGSESLSENIEKINFEGEAETSIMFKYGVDFFMGDIVGVSDGYGHDSRACVLELITSENEDGSTTTYPTFSAVELTEETPVILPEGYTQLEYIESSGTQWIDTGFAPNQDTRVIIDLMVMQSQRTLAHICSVEESSYFTLLFNPTSIKWYQTRYGSSILQQFPDSFNIRDRMTIDKNRRYTTIDLTVIDSGSYTFQLSKTLPLLARKTSSTTDSFLSARLYSCQIYNGNTLIRNFIPARYDAEETIGLYDIVNDVFYRNAGTGSFGTKDWEPGGLPAGYTQLSYIRSSGTQYIDTGFKPNQDTRVVCDAVFAKNTTASWLFGARESTTANNYGFLTYSGYYRSDYNNAAGAQITDTVSRVTIDKNKNVTSFNDAVKDTVTYAEFQCPYNLYLFANNSAGTVGGQSTTTLYSCQIYDNGVLIRDFVPCTNPSGVAGLYDLVNDVFYQNAGSGTFTTG